MKKLIPVLLAVLLLAATGCDLRNRQPSSDFIPATHATDTTYESGTPRPTEEKTEPPTAERQLTRHSIRTVVSENGSYTDVYGRSWDYDYLLPFVDYPSIEASRCNDEIEKDYNKVIKEQLKLVDTQEPLTAMKIDYACYYTGELVTLHVAMQLADGTIQHSVYCFRSDGTFSTNAEILEAVWVDEADFLSAVYDYLVTEYVKLNADKKNEVTYSQYYDKTVQQADDLESLSIYADEEDNMHVLADMYAADGGVTQIEFEVKIR